MNKYIKFLILVIAILPVHAFAVINVSLELPKYDAIVSNINGAEYYSEESVEGKYEYEKVGIIPNNTKIKVTFEKGGYARFNYNESYNNWIKIKDISPLKDEFSINEEIVTRMDEIEVKVFNPPNKEGIEIYKGPSSVYKKVGIIPIGETATAQYCIKIDGEPYSEEITWLYVNYNGVNGWVNFYDGGIGIKREEYLGGMVPYDKEVYLVEDAVTLPVYNDVHKTFEIKENAKSEVIPYGSIVGNEIQELYDTAAWHDYIYVKYNNKYYLYNVTEYILDKFAYKNKNIEKYITIAELKLYKEASTDSKVLISIPQGTKIDSTWHFGVMYMPWYYVEYNGIKGWVFDSLITELDELLTQDEYNERQEYLENCLIKESLNLYEDWNKDSKTLSVIPANTNLMGNKFLYLSDGVWFVVEYNGTRGYVFNPNDSELIVMSNGKKDEENNDENKKEEVIENNNASINESKVSSFKIIYICIAATIVTTLVSYMVIKIVNKTKNINEEAIINDEFIDNINNIENNNNSFDQKQ